MKRNCMNCLEAAGTIKHNGHKTWKCKRNGFLVNARMHCEEWSGVKVAASDTSLHDERKVM